MLRPFGTVLNGTKTNDIIQFDYIEMAKSTSNEKQLIMLRDDPSRYCWFYLFPDQTT